MDITDLVCSVTMAEKGTGSFFEEQRSWRWHVRIKEEYFGLAGY